MREGMEERIRAEQQQACEDADRKRDEALRLAEADDPGALVAAKLWRVAEMHAARILAE